MKLKEIVLAAPDVPRSDFEIKVATFLAQAKSGITLYASANDRAMIASKSVGYMDRAGFVPAGGPVIVTGVDTIDVSKVGTLGFFVTNHSLYAEREPLVVDMTTLFTQNTHPPSARSSRFMLAGTAPRNHWKYESRKQ